jgi:hypothetical protein
MKHRQRVPKKQEVISRIRRSKAELGRYLKDGGDWPRDEAMVRILRKPR